MARKHGKHALPRPAGRRSTSPRTAATRTSVTRYLATAGAMAVAVALAATMAIPAQSDTALASGAVLEDLPTHATVKAAPSQTLEYEATASTAAFSPRNGQYLVYSAIDVDGISSSGSSPATPLSESAHMTILPPDLTGGGAAVVQFAMQFVGKVPYILGGNSPATGFSCDTFVRYVYAAFGVKLVGNADVEATQATPIPESDAVAGDLVWYPGRHIGIYDGNGGIVDAPKPGRDVSHRAIWGHPTFLRIKDGLPATSTTASLAP